MIFPSYFGKQILFSEKIPFGHVENFYETSALKFLVRGQKKSQKVPIDIELKFFSMTKQQKIFMWRRRNQMLEKQLDFFRTKLERNTIVRLAFEKKNSGRNSGEG